MRNGVTSPWRGPPLYSAHRNPRPYGMISYRLETNQQLCLGTYDTHRCIPTRLLLQDFAT